MLKKYFTIFLLLILWMNTTYVWANNYDASELLKRNEEALKKKEEEEKRKEEEKKNAITLDKLEELNSINNFSRRENIEEIIDPVTKEKVLTSKQFQDKIESMINEKVLTLTKLDPEKRDYLKYHLWEEFLLYKGVLEQEIIAFDKYIQISSKYEKLLNSNKKYEEFDNRLKKIILSSIKDIKKIKTSSDMSLYIELLTKKIEIINFFKSSLLTNEEKNKDLLVICEGIYLQLTLHLKTLESWFSKNVLSSRYKAYYKDDVGNFLLRNYFKEADSYKESRMNYSINKNK